MKTTKFCTAFQCSPTSTRCVQTFSAPQSECIICQKTFSPGRLPSMASVGLRSVRPGRHELQVTASKAEGAKQMQEFSAGLSKKLENVEADLKQETRNSGNSSRMRVMAAAVEEGSEKSLQELDKDSFYPYLEKAGERLVVVDFYTDWCGPCKIMLNPLQDLAWDLKDKVDIVKFNCNAKNKEIGKNLNIRVAPTFHLYKNNNKIAEMTGAKLDELKELIDQNL